MSFSFAVKAKSKKEASQQVAEKLAEIVSQQPVHAKDAENVQKVVDAHLELIGEPNESQSVGVSANGSLSWIGSGDDIVITSANVGVGAYLTTL